MIGPQISEFKRWLTAAALLLSAAVHGQENLLRGYVLSADSLRPVPDTHVINVRSEKGTLTLPDGSFSIIAQPGDTLVFSNIAFSYLYWKVPSEPEGPHRILLQTRNYLLDEVSIFTYQLTTNEPKEMVLDQPLYPELPDDHFPVKPAPGLNQPLDALYEALASRPRQIRLLREQLAKAAFREKLKSGNNRKALMELTGLELEELEQFLFYCQYSPQFIQTSSDYAFLMSLLRCYEEYERTKKVEQILDENE